MFNTSTTIEITSQLPTIADALTIEGLGAQFLTIDANGGGDGQLDGDGFRIFEINDGDASNSIDVSISSLTLTGGDINNMTPVDGTGGSLINFENLTLDRVAITGNRARFGGGLGNESVGTLTLTNSTIANNESSQNGGGISTDGVFTGTNVTISGNSATGGGGAIVTAGRDATGATLTLNSSTVTANSDGNGSGVTFFNGYGPTTATFNNTIIDSVVFGVGNGGTTLSGSNNLFGFLDPGITGTDNQFNLSSTLGLGPLADNGGPTQTHALQAGSPAIDAGDAAQAAGLPTDQRGFPFARSFDDPSSAGTGGVDIGAFELQTLVLEVDSSLDENDGDFSVGNLSLREAISLTNGEPGEDRITFDATVFNGFGDNSVIRLTEGELQITDSLIIDGTSVGGVVITGDANDDDETVGSSDITDVSASFGNTAGATDDLLDDNSRVVRFTGSSGDLTLTGLAITGGRTTADSEEGGGIRFDSNGTLTLNNSTLSGNSTAGSASLGGGILTSFGDVSLVSSTLSGNSTSGNNSRGGGIYSQSGDVSLVSSTLSGNNSSNNFSNGGGIFIFSGDVSLVNSTLSGNSTSGNNSGGGGIYNSFGDVSLVSSTLSGNVGGGILTFSGDVSLVSSTLSGNSTSANNSRGGGIGTYSGDVSLVSSTVTGNSASGAGGGVFVFDSTSNVSLTISNSIVAGNFQNTTPGNPGTPNDLVPDPDGVLTINHSLIGVADGLTITGGNNLTGTAASPLDPLLGALSDNGGLTLTHALLPGSPAIDAGSSAFALDENGDPLTTDQRGESRIVDGDDDGTATVDIGAVEFDTPFVLGDANLDGVVDFSDIAPFINLLSTGGFLDQADIDRNMFVNFSDIAPFINILAGGTPIQANSFVAPETSSGSVVTSQAIVSAPPVSSAASVVADVVISAPEPIIAEAPATNNVDAEPAAFSLGFVATSPLQPATASLVSVTDSLAVPAAEARQPIEVVPPVVSTPVDTFVSPLAFAANEYSFFGGRTSSFIGSESKEPLAKRHSLTQNAKRVDLSNESRDQHPSGEVSIKRSFSTAAELFDADPELLDEVFDVESEGIFAELI